MKKKEEVGPICNFFILFLLAFSLSCEPNFNPTSYIKQLLFKEG